MPSTFTGSVRRTAWTSVSPSGGRSAGWPVAAASRTARITEPETPAQLVDEFRRGAEPPAGGRSLRADERQPAAGGPQQPFTLGGLALLREDVEQARQYRRIGRREQRLRFRGERVCLRGLTGGA